jgi:hypothetical protein
MEADSITTNGIMQVREAPIKAIWEIPRASLSCLDSTIFLPVKTGN